MKRKGVPVDKNNIMVGSYAPKAEDHSFKTGSSFEFHTNSPTSLAELGPNDHREGAPHFTYPYSNLKFQRRKQLHLVCLQEELIK